jgi:hypothetical protein
MRRNLAKPLTWIVVFTLFATLIGCLEIPLGDPEKSKVDDRFTGLWLQRGEGPDKGTLAAVVPYDPRTYLVTYMRFARGADKQVVAQEESTYKMWLTNVGGTTFITLEPKDAATLLGKTGTFFVVAKVSREGSVTTITDVSDKLVKEAHVTTPAEFEKLIAGRLGDPDLFGDTASYDLLGPDRADDAKSILAAFGRNVND